MRFSQKYLLVCVLTLCAVCGLAQTVSQSVTFAVEVFSPEPTQGPVLVIDAGHGGEDGGAVSCTGVKESEINLAVSLRLWDLMTLLGARTRMIRTEDVAVYSPEAATLSEKKVSDIKNRVSIVQQVPNAVLLSIHQNQFSEARYSGAQVFFAGTDGSEAFAELLQTRLCQRLQPSNHRQIKQSKTVYLLNKVTCPAVLVECGFLSNPEEERLLRDAAYQKKLVCVLASGVSDYLQGRTGQED